jgi:hypothetical protein
VSAFDGSLEPGGQFCVCVFGRNLASVAIKIFTFNLDFKKVFKFCTFDAICKYNVAINCIALQHKKKFHSLQL